MLSETLETFATSIYGARNLSAARIFSKRSPLLDPNPKYTCAIALSYPGNTRAQMSGASMIYHTGSAVRPVPLKLFQGYLSASVLDFLFQCFGIFLLHALFEGCWG